jgi:hypothetical protein
MSEEPKQPLDLAFIKEVYFHELENRHKLDSRMATLVVILSAIAGLLLYSIRTFTPGPTWFNVLTIVSLIAGGVLWIGAFVRLIQGTLRHKYEAIPSARDIEKTFADLQGFHGVHSREPGNARSSLDADLVASMVEAAHRNRNSNLTRGARYYSAMLWMSWSVALGIVAGTGVTVAEKMHQVREKGVQMSNEEKPAEAPQASGQPAEQPAQQPAQPAADSTPAVAKPTLPPNTVFKGNETPLTTRVITGETKKESGGK